jgi:hypothetical protein
MIRQDIVTTKMHVNIYIMVEEQIPLMVYRVPLLDLEQEGSHKTTDL